MEEKIPFSVLYENMQAILDKPMLYSVEITRFSAGGLGACAYSQPITIAELVRCWQHEEYQIQCPNCGETAYITQWAGHVNGGGYWEINAYCPHCGKEHHFPRAFSLATHHKIHWTKMRNVLQEERNAMKEMEKNDQGQYGENFRTDNSCHHPAQRPHAAVLSEGGNYAAHRQHDEIGYYGTVPACRS